MKPDASHTNPVQCISEHLFAGLFGFEKENIRITREGKLALTPHPKILGNKSKHPFITTDFSESQIEVITPPLPTISEALGFLETLQDLVSVEIDRENDELLWPQSAPPILPENEKDIPLAQYDENHKSQGEYREFLGQVYGRKRQMLSGIHFNLSFSERTIKFLYDNCNGSQKEGNFEQFRETIYFKTARNFLRYRWFLIALLGESPVIHKTYSENCTSHLPACTADSFHLPDTTSVRNNACGYRNKEEFPLNYASLKDYLASLDKLVEDKVLSDVRENYSAIRVKTDIDAKRISHLEIRILDLDPLCKIGINPFHAEICHLFLIFCLLEEERQEFCSDQQFRADYNHEQAARYGLSSDAELLDPQGKPHKIDDALHEFLGKLKSKVVDILPQSYEGALNFLQDIIEHPKKRPAAIILEKIKKHNFIDWHLTQAEEFLETSKRESFIFHGLRDMELSTQLLLRRTVLRGISFEIMDRSENFIRLKRDNHEEYVMQASRTALDPYSHVLMMENKVMTKKVLTKAGMNTPAGDQYLSIEAAERDFFFYKGHAIVIKPKSTNFGLGISIIKNNDDIDVFKRALEIAFEHDSAVLIEHFFAGKEYRFFIIGDEVVGILHRVPANVLGNGKSTIAELVVKKNHSPLRGKGYRTPLEKISLGEAEEMFLKSQGYDFFTIPKHNQIIYLRENSNISTGGDSIDFTDKIPQSYKDIALAATRAMGVQITGLDMMIPDLEAEANSDNYSIIEMNFNPALHIHCYPFVGNNRHIDDKILDALGY